MDPEPNAFSVQIHDEPPPYEMDDGNVSDGIVQPVILVLAGQSIHAESSESAPLYEVNRGVSSLSHVDTAVEFSRVEHNVRTNPDGTPLIKQRGRHLYNLVQVKDVMAWKATGLFHLQSVSRRTMGSFGLKRSSRLRKGDFKLARMISKKNDLNGPSFEDGGRYLFEVKRKGSRCQWTNSYGSPIAIEDVNNSQHVLVITAALSREQADVLVATWCLRLWYDSAENKIKEERRKDTPGFSIEIAKTTVYHAYSSPVERPSAFPRPKPPRMNAHALLTAQGWRGTGHSLHPTSDDNGLAHHILIKRNNNGSGLGSKKDHKAEAWWLNAFDQALKGIDTGGGTMKQTLRGGALEKITSKGAAKYTGSRGLYKSFVRGGVLQGTVDVSAALPTPPDSGVASPAGEEEEEVKETKEERRARREAKKSKKEQKRKEKEARRRAAEKVEKKKAKKAERSAGETKEERRARRDARRKRKEEKRRLKAFTG
ncbi:hypothetical protein DL762_005657 [Monosporascus cannonballus]|uniref:G-patch domain-containing protein n=1 Tax=Monosporascus cannonballus TaxID=155416 RepID=A0ABY0H467_9PEZI|nr:hypothetical protein DL762_005657 [Monosporascus cannonballus]